MDKPVLDGEESNNHFMWERNDTSEELAWDGA